MKESRKLIAEFMSIRVYTDKLISWNVLIETIKNFHALNLEFNDTWISWCQELDNTLTSDYDIETTFNTVVEAIKWYNSTKS